MGADRGFPVRAHAPLLLFTLVPPRGNPARDAAAKDPKRMQPLNKKLPREADFSCVTQDIRITLIGVPDFCPGRFRSFVAVVFDAAIRLPREEAGDRTTLSVASGSKEKPQCLPAARSLVVPRPSLGLLLVAITLARLGRQRRFPLQRRRRRAGRCRRRALQRGARRPGPPAPDPAQRIAQGCPRRL